MKLNIVKYGDPVLTKKAAPVENFDAELKELVENMFETMYAAPGVGLAAPQVGVLKRIFVMDCTKDHTRRIAFINPEILENEGKQKDQEGCLSFPGIYFDVERANQVKIKAQDINGKFFTLELTELEARCAAHETDHLDGELFINRISPLKREIIKGRINKQIKANKW